MKKLTVIAKVIFACLFFFLVAQPVRAEDERAALPQGQVLLNISATVRKDAAKDLLIATLKCSAERPDPQEVQNEINTTMKKALELAAKSPSVAVSTGNYMVYTGLDSIQKRQKWQGEQLIVLESKDSRTLLELAGKLQAMNFTMYGLNYEVDPKTLAELQDSMMDDALKQLQARADRAAHALGKSGAVLREVTVQGTSIPYPVLRTVGYASLRKGVTEMSEPVAKGGDTTVTLTVTGSAVLK